METRVKYASTITGKKVLGRILPGSDVIEGIEKICIENDIKNGWVDCIGSLKETNFFILTKQPQTKAGAAYGDPLHKDFPVELIAGQGLLVDGGAHVHAIMCGDDGVCFGGHLIKGGSPVLVTCEVSITEAVNLNCARGDDGEVDGMQFFPAGK